MAGYLDYIKGFCEVAQEREKLLEGDREDKV